ncbi:MAG: TetR/AcrR family transcriptional regulator [Deltaproteobacteria bacterium]|jgi:AcrR family transcriptional regulator|nr:TetR/AcrR family transcriptional regulator [Deltaproteobacteria bacterium]MBW2533871.1 TetR/AcrR family transcriptional regulator [Deltaproteobacteria bacterium]
MNSTRDKILDAADQLFGAVGFDAASTRLIADESGVNKALIHYHFSTKEALFGAVLDRYYERLTQVVLAALAGEGDLETRFGRLLDAYVDFLDENRAFSAMVQREVTGGRQLDRITGHMVPLFEQASELVKQAFPATRDGDMAASELLLSFYGMAVSYVNYRPVVDQLGDQPADPAAALARRKAHLRRMLALVVRTLAETAEPETPEPQRAPDR